MFLCVNAFIFEYNIIKGEMPMGGKNEKLF